MLVLSRKCEESLIIDGDEGTIEIKVVQINGDKVRLAVDAPKNFKILRKELLLIMESNQQAALSASAVSMKGLIAGFRRAKEKEEEKQEQQEQQEQDLPE